MRSRKRGAAECPYEKQIQKSSRRKAQKTGHSRSGAWIPWWKVHTDPITADAYSRALERGWKAYTTWDADAKDCMTLEAWIDAAIFGQDSAEFFQTPFTMSKTIVFDYLKASRSSTEEYEQRTLFEEMGHDPLDFDTISAAGAISITDHGPDATDLDDGDDDGDDPAATGWSHVEVEVMGRLFYTDDLDEVEAFVFALRGAGWSNTEIAKRLPAGVVDGYADPANQVSQIYSRAYAKATTFRFDL